MKMVLGAMLALLLGGAAGWRWDRGTGNTVAPDKAAAVRAPEAVVGFREKNDESVLGEGWRSWADRVKAATTTGELEALFGELLASEDRKLKATVGKLLGARWVEIDPAAGVRFLGESEGGSWALYPLLTEWVLLDQEAAMAGFAILGGQPGYHAKVAVLTQLLERRTPDATLNFIRATGKFVERGSRDAWRDLARARPAEFAALIAEIETANLKRGASYQAYNLIRIAAGVLAEEDPEAALAWGEGLYDKMQGDAMRVALETWAKKDPESLVRKRAEWEKESPPNRLARFGSVLVELAIARAMAKEDLDVAARWLSGPGVKPDRFAEEMALQIGRGERSFEAVFDAVSDVESHRDHVRSTVLSGMWDRMTAKELEGAFEVMRSKPENEARRLALSGILRESLQRDPAGATALANQVPRGPERNALIGEMLGSLNLDRQGHVAEALLNVLSDPDRAVVIGTLFAGEPSSGTTRPGVFAEALAATAASKGRADAIERLALHWGRSDPEGAMAWAQGFQGEEGVAATAAAARSWATEHAYSLADHLLEMPGGRPRDAATVSLVESVREDEPDSAWLWTARIEDPAMRGETRQAVLRAWVATDREAARSALEEADLSVTEREALRAVLTQ